MCLFFSLGFSSFVPPNDSPNDLENGTNSIHSEAMTNMNNRLSSTSSNGSEEDDVVNLEENLRVSPVFYRTIDLVFFNFLFLLLLELLCEEK